MRQRLITARSFWKQDVTALALVAVYVALAFIVVSGWNQLSEAANAFTADAQSLFRTDLADTVRFQSPAAKDTKNSAAEKLDEGAAFEGSLACGEDMFAICEELKSILPQ